jgi:hypothetical protein
MEDRAPYHTSVPKVPRNLAAPLAEWLRTQGFAVIERQDDGQATVAAVWFSSRNEVFELSYIWLARYASATLQLQARWPGQPNENLFGSQQVRRLRDMRLLVLGNVRYANARTLATMPHPVL